MDALEQNVHVLKNEVNLKEAMIKELNDELVLKNKELQEQGNEVDRIDFYLSWVYALLGSQIMDKCQLQEKQKQIKKKHQFV